MMSSQADISIPDNIKQCLKMWENEKDCDFTDEKVYDDK